MNVPDESPTTPSRRREGLIGAAAAVIVIALVVVGLLVNGSADGDRTPGAAAGPSAPASPSSAAVPDDDPAVPGAPVPETPADEPPAPEAPEAGNAAVLPAALPAVALDQEASGEDGVTAQVVSLEAIEGTAEGVGNIAGPALRATVRLTSETSEPLDLDLVSVTLTHGRDGTPASPLDDPSRAPFTGTLEPGETAEGVYVFTVPEDGRDVVALTVGYRAAAPFLVFSGSAD